MIIFLVAIDSMLRGRGHRSGFLPFLVISTSPVTLTTLMFVVPRDLRSNDTVEPEPEPEPNPMVTSTWKDRSTCRLQQQPMETYWDLHW
jgi:hypothetical protein